MEMLHYPAQGGLPAFRPDYNVASLKELWYTDVVQ